MLIFLFSLLSLYVCFYILYRKLISVYEKGWTKKKNIYCHFQTLVFRIEVILFLHNKNSVSFFFFDNSIQMLLKLKKHMEFPTLKPYGIPDISHQALRLLVFSFLVLSLSTSLHHILLITPPLSGNSVSLKTGFKQKSCGQQQQVQVISRTRHYLPH